MLPAPSTQAASEHRLEIRWHNARRALERAAWPAERLTELDAVVSAFAHNDADSFVIVQRADGHTFVEPMTMGLRTSVAVATVAAAPRLVEVIEHRQRTLPHVVVETDRTGATVSAFVGGRPTSSADVEGDTEFIHRGRGGGWSHRRFQQRAENTGERNAGEAAVVVTELAHAHDPVLIAIAGPVRAKQLLHDELEHEFGGLLVNLDAGDATGIVSEVGRALDDLHARLQRGTLDLLRSKHGLATVGAVRYGLEQGKVATLLVSDAAPEPEVVDDDVVAALRSGASVVVVPATADMAGGVAALKRW